MGYRSCRIVEYVLWFNSDCCYGGGRTGAASAIDIVVKAAVQVGRVTLFANDVY